METLPLYTWDFNRLPKDSNSDFHTFSVAVFQWQPKTSGRGLKKVNACRVCGYTLDPQAVYAKAQELCDRLTAENANASVRPKWLQKQYAVPKPERLVNPKRNRDLPGSVVRSIRLAVMKRLLLPAGFVKGQQGTYVRRVGDQIHLIDFQAARFGHQYTVNLAFHYSFLLPLFARKRIKLADYSQLDCGLRSRIGQFTKSARDRWYDYGTDRDLLQHTFEKNAQQSLRILLKAAEHFSQPERLLADSGCKLNKRLVVPWMALDGDFAPLLALHLGRRAAAISELTRLHAQSEGVLARRYEKLLAQLRAT
jgi:hypothetical protein